MQHCSTAALLALEYTIDDTESPYCQRGRSLMILTFPFDDTH
jgi:hypothetical protein